MSPNQSAFQDALARNPVVKIECACGHEITYDSFDEFEQAYQSNTLRVKTEGDWDWAFGHEQVTVVCPECGGEGSDVELRGKTTIAISTGTEFTTRESEGESLVGVTTPLPQRRVKFTEGVEEDLNVIHECECGCQRRFSSVSDFEDASDDEVQFSYMGHHLGYALADGNFELTCDSCGTDSVVATIHESDSGLDIVLTTAQSNGCPKCGAVVVEDGFKQGPDAPEIGWEYYECPACTERMRVERVGGQI